MLPNEDNIDEHLDESIINDINTQINKFEKLINKNTSDQYIECNRDFYLKIDKVLKRDYKNL